VLSQNGAKFEKQTNKFSTRASTGKSNTSLNLFLFYINHFQSRLTINVAKVCINIIHFRPNWTDIYGHKDYQWMVLLCGLSVI